MIVMVIRRLEVLVKSTAKLFQFSCHGLSLYSAVVKFSAWETELTRKLCLWILLRSKQGKWLHFAEFLNAKLL